LEQKSCFHYRDLQIQENLLEVEEEEEEAVMEGEEEEAVMEEGASIRNYYNATV